MNIKFYAIIDSKNGGICSVKHDEYASLKAVFNNREEAERAILKADIDGLFIKTVNIVGTGNEK